MNWRELNIIQYTGATSKERVEARKLLDAERIRCYNHDRQFGTHLLHQFTVEYMEGFDMADVEIDDGVPPPPANEAEPPKRRGRPRGASSKPAENSNLLAATAFVSVVETEAFEMSQYAALRNMTMTAYSNVLAAGFPVAEELQLCPHLDKLKAALNKCGKSLAITQHNGALSIKGDKLRALVPCLAEPLAAVFPDPVVVSGEFDILKAAFMACNTVADEKAEKPMYASVLLDPNTATATNGKVMLQYWHGIANLPPGTVLPALFCKLVSSIKYKITGIGGNYDPEAGFMRSFTVWFENGSWLKTQTYEDRWQAYEHLLNVETNPQPVPDGLFEGVGAVEAFCEDTGAVVFNEGFVSSHREADNGATYEVKGLTAGKIFDARLIKQVSPYVKTLDLTSSPDRGFFFGGSEVNPIRGVFMGMVGSR